MAGMDRFTGEQIDGAALRRQSITDVLTTPIGTRVLRRRYGCFLFDLVDTPATPAGRLKVVAAVAHALAVWVPEIRMLSASVTVSATGKALISVTYEEKASSEQASVEVPL